MRSVPLIIYPRAYFPRVTASKEKGFGDENGENLDAMREADRELGVGLGAKKRTITETKKAILRDLGIKVRKGDSLNTKFLLERLRLTVRRVMLTVQSLTGLRSSFKRVMD